MDQEELQKVTEAELLEASYSRGRQIATLVEGMDPDLASLPFRDSLEKAYHSTLLFLTPKTLALSGMEGQILEAYIAGATEGGLQDHVQKMGADSMVYTKPIFRKEQGQEVFIKALSIRMHKKEIILSIRK